MPQNLLMKWMSIILLWRQTLLLQRSAKETSCVAQPLVRNADAVLTYSKAVLGRTLTNAVVKRTFFQHFCAGGLSDVMPSSSVRNLMFTWPGSFTAAVLLHTALHAGPGHSSRLRHAQPASAHAHDSVACASTGENAEELRPALRYLRSNGIGGIVAYSVEDDVASCGDGGAASLGDLDREAEASSSEFWKHFSALVVHIK